MSISADRLEYFRSIAVAALDRVCNIERLTDTNDDQGGVVRTWNTIASNVPCDLNPLRGTAVETSIANMIQATNLWWIQMHPAISIGIEDRIDLAGRKYSVGYIAEPESYEILKRVVVTEYE